MTDLQTKHRAKQKDNAARVRKCYKNLRASGGKRVTVQLSAEELQAVRSIALYSEAIATTLRRVAMDAAKCNPSKCRPGS